MSSFDDAYSRLKSWTKALQKVTEDHEEEIGQYVRGARDTPENCPSNASMALTIFSQIEKRLYEVESAVEDVRMAIAADAV